ncbi:hypothetical protein ACQUKI_20630 [Ralstonia pseudosolanacearum]
MLAVSSGAEAQVPAVSDGAEQMHLAVIHDDLQRISAQLSKVALSQDAHSFCYFGGQAYSLGAVRDGWRCESAGVHVSTQDGALDRERSDPLRWIPAGSKVAGPRAAKVN